MTNEKAVSRKKATRLQKIELELDRSTVELARKLGDGDLSLGLRRAVALALLKDGAGLK